MRGLRFWQAFALFFWCADALLTLLYWVSPRVPDASGLLFPAAFSVTGAMVWYARRLAKSNWHELLSSALRGMLVAAGLCALYAFFAFFYSLSVLGTGIPEYAGGVYRLWENGAARILTEEEALRYLQAQRRLFSGHLLPFFALPSVFFTAMRRKELS